MAKDFNAIKTFLILFCLSCILIPLVEYGQILPNMRIAYLCFRVLFAGTAVTAILVLKNDINSFRGNLIAAFTAGLSPAVFAFFQPGYEYLLIIGMLGFALFFYVGKLFINLFLTISFIFFSISYYVNYQRNVVLAPAISVWDNLLSFFWFVAMAWIIFHTLSFQRRERDKAILRYTLIGQQASRIIHDLKNLIMTPSLELESLKPLIKNHPDENVRHLIENLGTTLSEASRLTLSFNQMSVLANNRRQLLSLSELIEEIKFLLRNRLRNVDVVVEGDLTIEVDQGFMQSVFLNLFMNSLDSLQEVKIKKILINLNKSRILFEDSGKGFSQDVLAKLNKNESITQGKNGSGIGLIILREACEDLKAHVIFKNAGLGACVEIRFN